MNDKRYGYVFPSVADVYDRTARFITPTPAYEQATVDRWVETLHRAYPELGRTKVVDFEELTIKPDSAPGPLADACCRQTRDLLRWFYKRVWKYWNRAIKEGWPVFWKTSGKVEMLPAGKKPRTFVFMDKFFNLCFSRVTADLNEKMKLDKDHTMSAIGMSIYGRDYINMAEKLAAYPKILEADVSEWDARFHKMICRAIRDFRMESMMDEYGKLWIEYKYETMGFPLIFMPSGELVEVNQGNMSGQDSTSTDNTLGHTLLVEDAKTETLAKEPEFDSEIKLYGDDFVGGLSSDKNFPEILKQVYLRNSFVVKEAAFKIRDSLDGTRFLGGKFRKCALHGHWTYVPSKRKLLESLYSCVKEMSDLEFYGKVFSLYILGYHTKWRERFRRYYLDARRLLTKPPPFWTDREIECFVHGLEGSRKVEVPIHFDPAM